MTSETAAPSVATVPGIPLPAGDGWTWEELQAIPDEAHHHYELIEGQILMSPGPNLRHQMCVLNLAVALRAAASADLQVIISPFDFAPERGTVLRPDVLVVRRGSTEWQRTIAPPVLAIEVISPSGRTTDTVTKRELYARFGVAHYWIVDPAEPSVLTLERTADGAYAEAGRAQGSEPLSVERPFALTVVPSALVDDGVPGGS